MSTLSPSEMLKSLRGTHNYAEIMAVFEQLENVVILGAARMPHHTMDELEIGDCLADPEIVCQRYDVDALAASKPVYLDELEDKRLEPLIRTIAGSGSAGAYKAAAGALERLGWAVTRFYGHSQAQWCLLPLQRDLGPPLLLL